MNKSILICDYDGVFNSLGYFKSERYQNQIIKLGHDNIANHLDPSNIFYLNKLIYETQSNIVVSSTWRNVYSLGEIRSAMRQAGFQYSKSIVDKTPRLKGKDRGLEIKCWIDLNNFRGKFAILEDDVSDVIPYFPNETFQTFYYHMEYGGLTNEISQKVIDFLKYET